MMKLLKRNPTISHPARSDSEWSELYWYQKLLEARTAWIVAGIFLALLVETRLEFIFLEPKLIKEVVPFAYDQQTGVYQQMVSLDDTQIIAPSNEMTRGSLKAFVEAREGYDYFNMNAPFTRVSSMATGRVAEEYNAIYAGQKPLDEQITDTVRVVVNANYVSPTGDDTRTVRFTKTMYARNKVTTTEHIATIRFVYDPGVELEEDESLANPLRLQIYYYNVEADIGGTL